MDWIDVLLGTLLTLVALGCAYIWTKLIVGPPDEDGED